MLFWKRRLWSHYNNLQVFVCGIVECCHPWLFCQRSFIIQFTPVQYFFILIMQTSIYKIKVFQEEFMSENKHSGHSQTEFVFKFS